MEDKQNSSNADSIEDIFGTDLQISQHLPIKSEVILPDEANDDTPIKVESFSVTEIQQQISDKKKCILAMSEEVFALENKISQEIADPINTTSDQNVSENISSENVVSQNLLLNDNLVILGSLDNPVMISSDEEILDNQICSDEAKDSSLDPNWYVDKDRYFCDLTNANPGNFELTDSNISTTQPEPTPESSKIHSNSGVTESSSSSVILANSSSAGIFETSFSKQINSQKRVSFADDIQFGNRKLVNKRSHEMSSSDSSGSEQNEPFLKKLKKQLTPNIRSQQKIALTKTVNKDGSKSLSANISITTSSPRPFQLQDSGIFSEPPQKVSLNYEEEKMRYKNRSTLSCGKSSNSEPSASTHGSNPVLKISSQLVPAPSMVLNSPTNQPQQFSLNIPLLQQSFNQHIMLASQSLALSSPNLPISHSPNEPTDSPTTVAKIADIIKSSLQEIKNPKNAKQSKAILQAALDSLNVDNEDREALVDGQSTSKANQTKPVDQPDLIDISQAEHSTPKVVNIQDIEDDLSNYQFESPFTYLKDVRDEVLNPNFTRVSSGTRGLVSLNVVSHEDFAKLEPWQIPGLPFDFGDNLSLKDATALLTNDRLENNINLPSEEFSLHQVNEYLRVMNNKNNNAKTNNNNLMGKLNRLLGQDFYDSYQWIDTDERVLTSRDINAFLVKNNAEMLEANIAPWPCTIVPRDCASSVKYQSVFKDGVEYVSRTVCGRQSGIDFFTDGSQIFKCVVCGDIISTPYHVYVFCYIFKPNFSFERLQNWKDTWLRGCYIHWKINGISMPNRNIYADARAKKPRGGPRGTWRGRGSRRGTFVRSLFN